jgi:hypothetical protein
MQRKILFCAIVVFLSLGSCFGQVNTGKISGFVSDESGAMMTGIPITAVNDSTGIATMGNTSETGEYLLNFLVPATYHVTVERPGFRKAVRVARSSSTPACIDRASTSPCAWARACRSVTVEAESHQGIATETFRALADLLAMQDWIKRCPTSIAIRSTR